MLKLRFSAATKEEMNVSKSSKSLALGALLALAVPTIAVALPHQFTSGTQLTAAQLNANFDEIETRLAELEAARELTVVSQSSGAFQTTSDARVPIPNASVQLVTQGGPVRLELVPAAGLTGSVGGSDSGAGFTTFVWFERSSDGVSWSLVGAASFGASGTQPSTTAPPAAFAVIDQQATAGTWHFRALLSDSGAGSLASVSNVCLAATRSAAP